MHLHTREVWTRALPGCSRKLYKKDPSKHLYLIIHHFLLFRVSFKTPWYLGVAPPHSPAMLSGSAPAIPPNDPIPCAAAGNEPAAQVTMQVQLPSLPMVPCPGVTASDAAGGLTNEAVGVLASPAAVVADGSVMGVALPSPFCSIASC